MKAENFITPITFLLMFLWIISVIILYITQNDAILEIPSIGTVIYGIIRVHEYLK